MLACLQFLNYSIVYYEISERGSAQCVKSTVKLLIFTASQFHEFKRVIYWRSYILAVTLFNVLYNYFNYFLFSYGLLLNK